MPSYAMKRGRRRVRAAVMVQGSVRQKWWPDDTQKSYRQACIWEEEARAQILSVLSGDPAAQTDTVCCPDLLSWLSAYLDHVQPPRMASKTYQEKRGAIKRFILHAGADALAKDITPGTVLGFFDAQAKTRSGYAVNKDRKNLAAAWSWGVKYVEGFPVDLNNPFAAADKLPETRQDRYVPSMADFHKVYEIAQGQDRVMLTTFLHLGARRGEVFRLRWSKDIDFEGAKVRIGTRKRKDGSMEYDWLPMTDELRSELAWWWENRPMKEAEHLFCQIYDSPSRWHEPGKPFKTRQHFMAEICAMAGVRKFGFHAIRHLTATTLYKSGYALAFIQRILRHKSARTTEIYLRSLGLDDFQFDGKIFAKKTGKVIPFSKKQNPPEAGTSEGFVPEFVPGSIAKES